MYISQHLSINFGAKILNIQTQDHICPEGWQFLAIQKGAVTIIYEDTGEKIMLQQEDVLLLNPGRSYICSPYSPNILLGVLIDDSFFSTLLESNQSFFCDSTKGPKGHYHHLYQLITRICAAFYTEDNHYRMISLIFELADVMKRNFVQSQDTASMTNSELLVQKRISAIEHFLQTSYHQPVSLELLADQMFLSPQYLSKFIKKHLGCTFSHYLAGIRLEHAHTELLNTEDSITAIALNNGFPNIAAFNKAFRDNYGSSPSSYRTAHKIVPKREQDPSLLLPQELLEPSPSYREIHTSCTGPNPYQKPWCDTINIGSLLDALKISFHDSFFGISENDSGYLCTFHGYFFRRYRIPGRSDRGIQLHHFRRGAGVLLSCQCGSFHRIGLQAPEKSYQIRYSRLLGNDIFSPKGGRLLLQASLCPAGPLHPKIRYQVHLSLAL